MLGGREDRQGTPPDLLGQGHGLLERPDPQLALQHLGAALVGPERGGAVAQQVVQPHHPPVRGFGDGVGLQELLRPGQRFGQLALALEALAQQAQRLPPQLPQPLALVEQPLLELGAVVVVVALQQLPLPLQPLPLPGGDLALQLGHVALDPRPQAQGVTAREQPLEAAQVEEGLAQVVAGGGVGALGPQQPGEPRARGGPLQRQVGQQGRRLALERDRGLAGAVEVRGAQHPELPGGHRPDFTPGRREFVNHPYRPLRSLVGAFRGETMHRRDPQNPGRFTTAPARRASSSGIAPAQRSLPLGGALGARPSEFYGTAAGCGAKPYPYQPPTPGFKVRSEGPPGPRRCRYSGNRVPEAYLATKEVSGCSALASARGSTSLTKPQLGQGLPPQTPIG